MPASPSTPTVDDCARSSQAEDWFEDANQNPSREVSFRDNDPPFYIHHQASSDGISASGTPSDSFSTKNSGLGKPTAPTRSLLARIESSESNSEGFRSVIDDLTVENKKLKKKLKQFEKLHCSHLQEDKLFEVKFHRLATHKRRELEETLRKFASSTEDLPSPDPAFNPLHGKYSGAAPDHLASSRPTVRDQFSSTESLPALHKQSSASTSCSKPIDSAYASMSGQTGPPQLQQRDRGRSDRMIQASQKQQSVKSYLHDIPETLIPKHSRTMSERSKSKMVVKRLEQLFTGKGDASRRSIHSHQQQEISNSAAYADQVRLNARDRKRPMDQEGQREARILPNEVELQVDSLSEANSAAQESQPSSINRRASTRSVHLSRDQSPNQRPTRPLDLDLRRAQVPAENINYIRHLGLSSPIGNSNLDTEDGWVYLNLLTSMAQLHTLNVTPGFIRQAVANISTKFELSSDGTTVRWHGGSKGTRLSSDSEGISDVGEAHTTAGEVSVGKSRSLANTLNKEGFHDVEELNTALPVLSYESSNDVELASSRRPVFAHQTSNAADFHYEPLFFHGVPSEQDGSDALTNSLASSDIMENTTAMNSGINSGINSGSHGMREAEVKLRKHNTKTGPIIFYHKARFCTDLSANPSRELTDENVYSRCTQNLLGCPPTDSDNTEELDEDGILSTIDSEVVNDRPYNQDLDLEDLRSCISECFSSRSSATQLPVPMEASGLGGIQPEDNFIVKVQVRHRIAGKSSSSSPQGIDKWVKSCLSPCRAEIKIPRSHPSDLPVKSEIVSASKSSLKPSSLPPPSYVCLPISSSGSEGDESEDEASNASHLDRNGLRHQEVYSSFASKPRGCFYGSPSNGSKRSSHDATISDSEESSIDLLAHARVLDPDAVAERERDFEENAIPMESAAATAGESTSENLKAMQLAESDVDSMSMERDNGSSMGEKA